MGTMVMLAFSYLAFTAARRTGRNPIVWIALVWVMGTALAIPSAVVGWIIDFVAAVPEKRQANDVEPYLTYWASAAGCTIGSGIAVLLAFRPLPQPPIMAEIAEQQTPPV